jgi:hypothetical protein
MTFAGTMSAENTELGISSGGTMDNLRNQNQTDTGTTSGTFSGNWNNDRSWWQQNYNTRPYVSADRRFEDYEPGYRFGYEAANRYRGRNFNDVELNLRSDWDRYEGRGQSTWDHVKDAVRDAWDKVTGKF